MEKDSALYQLIDVRMNGVMNSIVSSDGEYQESIRRSDVYSGRPEQMEPAFSIMSIKFRLLFHASSASAIPLQKL